MGNSNSFGNKGVELFDDVMKQNDLPRHIKEKLLPIFLQSYKQIIAGINVQSFSQIVILFLGEFKDHPEFEFNTASHLYRNFKANERKRIFQCFRDYSEVYAYATKHNLHE